MSLKSNRQTGHYRQRQILQLILSRAVDSLVSVSVSVTGPEGLRFVCPILWPYCTQGQQLPQPPPTPYRPRITAFMSYLERTLTNVLISAGSRWLHFVTGVRKIVLGSANLSTAFA